MTSILTEETYELLQHIFMQLMMGNKTAALALADQLKAAVEHING